jgi:hypothetical protein
MGLASGQRLSEGDLLSWGSANWKVACRDAMAITLWLSGEVWMARYNYDTINNKVPPMGI